MLTQVGLAIGACSYDLDSDPYQISNIYNASSTSVKSALAAELHQFWHCAGSTCP